MTKDERVYVPIERDIWPKTESRIAHILTFSDACIHENVEIHMCGTNRVSGIPLVAMCHAVRRGLQWEACTEYIAIETCSKFRSAASTHSTTVNAPVNTLINSITHRASTAEALRVAQSFSCLCAQMPSTCRARVCGFVLARAVVLAHPGHFDAFIGCRIEGLEVREWIRREYG